MAFTKGAKRPAGAGIKKGQKQQRTMMREALEAKGIDLIDELAGLIQRAKKKKNDVLLAEHIRTALPYCFKKMPIDHALVDSKGNSVDYTPVLMANGIKPRQPHKLNPSNQEKK